MGMIIGLPSAVPSSNTGKLSNDKTVVRSTIGEFQLCNTAAPKFAAALSFFIVVTFLRRLFFANGQRRNIARGIPNREIAPSLHHRRLCAATGTSALDCMNAGGGAPKVGALGDAGRQPAPAFSAFSKSCISTVAEHLDVAARL